MIDPTPLTDRRIITIALGGQSMSIQRWVRADRYYTPTLLCPDPYGSDLDSYLGTLGTFSIDVVRLIGFSRGAIWAIQMYERHPTVVTEVYAHSPGAVAPIRRTNGHIRLYRTQGDRAGRVYGGTSQLFLDYKSLGHQDVNLLTLQPTPERPRGLVERWAFNRNHQFHNVVPYLPEENRVG